MNDKGLEEQKPIIGPDDLLASSTAEKLARIEARLGKKLESVGQPFALIARLKAELAERRRRRLPIEDEMLDSYRRYNNEYDPTTKAKFRPKKSKVWVGLTAMKVNTAKAVLMDFLRSEEDRLWDLVPDEIDADYELPDYLALQVSSPEEEQELIDLIREDMERRVRMMKREMKNQLDITDFPEHLEQAVLEMCITGSGGLKGPITVPNKEAAYDMAFDENMGLTPVPIEPTGYRPAVSFVSAFNLYPDMDVSDPRRGEGIFEEMLLSRKELIELAKQPGFKSESILQLLRDHPNGNAHLEPHQVELRTLGGDADPQATNKYQIYCYYGPITGRDLSSCGIDVGDDAINHEVMSNVYFCDNYLLKAKTYWGKIPYVIIPYLRRDGFGPFGRSIPMLIKSSQDSVNAAARMILDNAAVASGPFVTANVKKLVPGEDPTDLHGWKVFLVEDDNPISGARPVEIHDIPAYTDLFIKIFELFRKMADEESFIPSITQGEQGIGVTKTVGGMSILNTNANRAMKDIMRNTDDRGTEPLIEAVYQWNMKFNPNIFALVPAKVKARGTAAVMAKELETQRLLQLIQGFADLPFFKTAEAIREVMAGLDFDPDRFVMSDEEIKRSMEQQAALLPEEAEVAK